MVESKMCEKCGGELLYVTIWLAGGGARAINAEVCVKCSDGVEVP